MSVPNELLARYYKTSNFNTTLKVNNPPEKKQLKSYNSLYLENIQLKKQVKTLADTITKLKRENLKGKKN